MLSVDKLCYYVHDLKGTQGARDDTSLSGTRTIDISNGDIGPKSEGFYKPC